MEKNNSSQEILEKIKSAKKILIKLHEGPDGDSLASCVAMKYLIERDFGIKVVIISPDNLAEQLNSFDFVKEIEFGKGLADYDLNEFDVVLFLDHGAFSYFGKNDIVVPKGSLMNIDHHPTNDYYGDLNYVNSKRPSTCSVLLDLFKEWKINFDKELATRLLIGIYTDSGEFSHDAGGALKDASFLIDQGADYLEGVVNKIKYNVPLGAKKYFALITEKFKVIEFEGHKIGISVVSKNEVEKLNLNLSEVRGGINYLQEIGGVDFLFTLVEMDNVIKGSFRSRKKINVSLFAKELGGGGHLVAAAFRMNKIPLEEAEKKVLDAIKKIGIHKIE